MRTNILFTAVALVQIASINYIRKSSTNKNFHLICVFRTFVNSLIEYIILEGLTRGILQLGL